MKKTALVLFCLALGSPATLAMAKDPPMTPMQIQALQQKEFEADKSAVFSSVIDVLQDLGYTINSADLNTGFITAESATTNKTSFWDALGYVAGSGNTRATAYIETMPSQRTRVRLNFVSTKTMSGLRGQSTREDKPILDARVYQAAFDKVDEAVFVRRAVNAPLPKPTAQAPTAASASAAAPAPVASTPVSSVNPPPAPAPVAATTPPAKRPTAAVQVKPAPAKPGCLKSVTNPDAVTCSK